MTPKRFPLQRVAGVFEANPRCALPLSVYETASFRQPSAFKFIRGIVVIQNFRKDAIPADVLNQALAEMMKRGAWCSLPGSPAIDGQVIKVHRRPARSSLSVQLKLGLHHTDLPTQRER